MTGKTQPRRVLAVPVQSAGVCTAAGGLGATMAQWAGGGGAIGSILLDAYDCTGDAVAARAALVEATSDAQTPELSFMARMQPMLVAAVADLCQATALRPKDLAQERLFIVVPESDRALGASWVRQAWMHLHGALAESEQQAMQQRISAHSSVVDALGAAVGWLPLSEAGVLVLCCESWLTREALAVLDAPTCCAAPAATVSCPARLRSCCACTPPRQACAAPRPWNQKTAIATSAPWARRSVTPCWLCMPVAAGLPRCCAMPMQTCVRWPVKRNS